MAERARGSAKRTRAKRKANGHNGGPYLGNDIPDELRQRHLEAIEQAEAAVERARAPFKTAQARARAAYKLAEDDGLHIDGLRDARKLSKRDRLDVLARYQETGHCLRLMKSPLAMQLELFRTPSWPEPVSANLAGYRAGKMGLAFEVDCPHPPGSEQYIVYKAGFDTAQQELQEQLLER